MLVARPIEVKNGAVPKLLRVIINIVEQINIQR